MNAKRTKRQRDLSLRQQAESRLRQPTSSTGKRRASKSAGLEHELKVHQQELEVQNEELRRAQGELEASRDRYVALYEFAPVGYLTVQSGGNILEANLTACQLLGVERSRLIRKPIRRFIAAGSWEEFDRHRQQVLSTGERQSCELTLRRPGGITFAARLETTVAGEAPVEPRTLLVTLDDISQRRQAEALAVREKQLTLFVEHAPAAIAMLDKNMRYLAVSQRWMDDYGLFGQPVVGQNYYELFSEIPRHWREVHRRCLGGATERAEEELIQRADGSLQWLRWVVCPWRKSSGEVGGLMILSEDATARKRAEEALRRSEERFRHTLDHMLEGCQTIGFDWRCLYANPAAARHGHLSLEEMIGRPVTEAYPGLERTPIFAVLQECMKNRTARSLENRFTYPEGDSAWFQLSIQPVPEGLFVLSIDINERKELEKELLEISDREQRRIGHDLHDGLCQHLAGIEFRLLDLRQKLEARSKKRASEVNELARLVRDGIDQTRMLAQGLSPVMLEPAGLMNGLRELASNTQKVYKISCSFNCLEAVLMHDNAAAAHLYRIAQEAVHNAIRHGKPNSIIINLFTQRDRIVLGVRDDGVGFEKPSGKHPGMGLRVMQYRAALVGGSLVVQREAGGGTSVICSLRAGAGLGGSRSGRITQKP